MKNTRKFFLFNLIFLKTIQACGLVGKLGYIIIWIGTTLEYTTLLSMLIDQNFTQEIIAEESENMEILLSVLDTSPDTKEKPKLFNIAPVKDEK